MHFTSCPFCIGITPGQAGQHTPSPPLLFSYDTTLCNVSPFTFQTSFPRNVYSGKEMLRQPSQKCQITLTQAHHMDSSAASTLLPNCVCVHISISKSCSQINSQKHNCRNERHAIDIFFFFFYFLTIASLDAWLSSSSILFYLWEHSGQKLVILRGILTAGLL